MTDDEKRLPQPSDETVEQMEREGFMPPPPLRGDTETGFAVGDEAHVWTPETIEQAFSPPRDLRPTRDKIDEIAADLAVTYRATFEFPPDTPPVTLYWSDDHEDADRRLPDAYEKLKRDGGWVVLNDQVVGRIEPGTVIQDPPPVEPDDEDLGYDVGYRDGESNGYADWILALSEEVPDDVDVSRPSLAAEYVRGLLTELGRAPD